MQPVNIFLIPFYMSQNPGDLGNMDVNWNGLSTGWNSFLNRTE